MPSLSYFSEIVAFNLHLQYKIELARNGMVNGASSTLPIADRLQRLRQYASNFQRGIFDYEDLSAYLDYVSQIFKLEWGTEFPDYSPFSRLYGRASRTHLALSVFTLVSVAAGIQSSHHLLPIGEPAELGLFVAAWATMHKICSLWLSRLTQKLLCPGKFGAGACRIL